MLIIYELRKLLKRISEDKLFIIENVKSLKKVGFYVILVGLVDTLNRIIVGGFGVVFTRLFREENGSTTLGVFLFIIIGCTVLVISEVVEKAIQLKGENDLTI